MLKACNPIIMNGITDFITRQDLVDRACVIRLERIHKRKSEKALWSDFDAAHPAILGGLLNNLSGVLKQLPNIDEDDYVLPRMTDFGRVGIALEKHLNWPDGTFLEAYQANKLDAIITGLDSEPVAAAVEQLMLSHNRYENTVDGLLKCLSDLVSEEVRRNSQKWPSAPHVLTSRLKRLAPGLRAIGIDVLTGEEAGRTATGRKVIISKIDDKSVTSVTASLNDTDDANDANSESF